MERKWHSKERVADTQRERGRYGRVKRRMTKNERERGRYERMAE